LAFFTYSAAIWPFAPALFSTTTGCFSRSASFCPTMRATLSVPLPAAKDTTSVIGRLG